MKKFFIVISIIVIIFYLAFSYAKVLLPLEYKEIVEKYSEEYNLEESLVFAMIKAESNFNPSVISKKDAKGLMQLTEETSLWCAEKMELQDFSLDKLENPETNIMMGTWYFKYLLLEFEDEKLAIIAYNAGINNVKKWIKNGVITNNEELYKNIPYNETQKYILKVKLFKKLYKVLYNI